MAIVRLLGRTILLPDGLELPLAPTTFDCLPDLTVSIGSLKAPEHRFALDSHVQLEFAPGRAGVVAFGNIGPRSMEHYLVDHGVPQGLAWGGDIVLHAAGVVAGRGATLICSESGRGKSTTCAVLCEHSWRLLGDDAIRLEPAEDACRVWPNYAGIRLHPDVLSDGVVTMSGCTAEVGENTGKRRLDVRTELHATTSEVCSRVIDLDLPGPWRVEAIGPAALCSTLAQHYMHPPGDPASAIDRLERLMPLASVLQGYRVRFPRSREGVNQLAAWLREVERS